MSSPNPTRLTGSMNPQFGKRLSGAVAAAALTLLMIGCTAPTAPTDEAAPPSEAVDTPAATDDQGATDTPIPVPLPATYPVDAVPLIDGVIVSAADASILWNVIIVPDSPMDEVADEAQALLTAQGMTLVAQKEENRAYQSAEFDVNVNLHDDGTVSYTVRPR